MIVKLSDGWRLKMFDSIIIWSQEHANRRNYEGRNQLSKQNWHPSERLLDLERNREGIVWNRLLGKVFDLWFSRKLRYEENQHCDNECKTKKSSSTRSTNSAKNTPYTCDKILHFIYWSRLTVHRNGICGERRSEQTDTIPKIIRQAHFRKRHLGFCILNSVGSKLPSQIIDNAPWLEMSKSSSYSGQIG